MQACGSFRLVVTFRSREYVNGWVSTSPTIPGLCTSGQILLTDSDVTHSEICPDLQRPGRGVVGLVMTHWLTWYPQIPPIMKCGIEKIMDRCDLRLLNKCAYVFSVFKMWIRVSFASRSQVSRHNSASKSPQGHQVLGMGDSGSGRRGRRESEAVKRSFGVSDLSDRVSDVQGSARALANTPIQETGMATYAPHVKTLI